MIKRIVYLVVLVGALVSLAFSIIEGFQHQYAHATYNLLLALFGFYLVDQEYPR